MSEQLDQLRVLFQQLEDWDTRGRQSISGSVVVITPKNLPESDDATPETALSRNVNQYNDLCTQIRELAETTPDQAIIAYLTECLQHNYLSIRLQAVEALGFTRSAHAIGVLVDTMQHDKDYGVKAAAAQSLGIIGNIMATPSLVEVLQSEIIYSGEVKVRRACADALSFMSDPSATDALIEILTRNYGAFESSASDIRESTRDALVSIGGEAVVDQLIGLWGKAVLHPIDYVDESIRHEIIIAFGQIEHPKALDFLLKLAHHENSMIREVVMSSLSYRRDARVVQALTDALEDVDSSVRESAELSLRQLGQYP